MANFRLLLLLCSTLISLAGCGTAETAPKGLVYCSEGNPETFNPQHTTSGTAIDATSKQLYNRLLRFDEQTGDIVSDLATNWQWSADHKTLKLTLRQGVQFHTNHGFTPTRAFNADDVLFSFNRVIDPTHPYHLVGGGHYPFFQTAGLSEQILQIHRYSDFEIGFELATVNANFLNTLATDFAIILSAEYAEWLLANQKPEQIDISPIGTGPFLLSKHQHNRIIRYRRHPEYWQGAVKLEHLVYDITPTSTSRVIKLIGGDCDVAALPQVGELSVIQSYDDLSLDTRPSFNVAYWAFNSQKPPLNDVRVRKALALAVDQKRILAAVYRNSAVASRSLLPPVSWAYDEGLETPEYNPTLARQLLRSAGIDNLSITIWATPVGRIYNPNSLKTAELIQQDLSNIGVTAQIVSYNWGLFIDRLKHAEYDSVLLGWSADIQDPDNFFTPLLSCNALLFGSNRARWCNKRFDSLIEEARNSADIEERKRLYRRLELELKQYMPLLPLAHASRTLGRQRQWQGNILNITGGIDFASVHRGP